MPASAVHSRLPDKNEISAGEPPAAEQSSSCLSRTVAALAQTAILSLESGHVTAQACLWRLRSVPLNVRNQVCHGGTRYPCELVDRLPVGKINVVASAGFAQSGSIGTHGSWLAAASRLLTGFARGISPLPALIATEAGARLAMKKAGSALDCVVGVPAIFDRLLELTGER